MNSPALIFNLNTQRNSYCVENTAISISMPRAPILDAYDFVPYAGAFERVPLSVSLPEAFLGNVPESILAHLQGQSFQFLRQVDLFWTVQAQSRLLDDQPRLLKTHFWVRPDLGRVQNFVTSVFDRHLQMGIFESGPGMQPQPHQVPVGRLAPFHVSIHAQPEGSGISPNTAQVAIPYGAALIPMSFWSLVIDREEQRAAISLHWLLAPVEAIQVSTFVNLLQRDEVRSLRDLVNALEAESGRQDRAYDARMLDQLRILVRD